MAGGTIVFNRHYAAFGNQVNPYEKADGVGSVLSWMLGRWKDDYPVGALINAKISAIWLGKGEKPVGDVDNIDLLFKMAQPGDGLIEIILRSKGNPPLYGGWAFGESLEVTDEIVNGQRVLIATAGAEKIRYQYTPDNPLFDELGPIYWPDPAQNLSTEVARSLARKSRR